MQVYSTIAEAMIRRWVDGNFRTGSVKIYMNGRSAKVVDKNGDSLYLVYDPEQREVNVYDPEEIQHPAGRHRADLPGDRAGKRETRLDHIVAGIFPAFGSVQRELRRKRRVSGPPGVQTSEGQHYVVQAVDIKKKRQTEGAAAFSQGL